MDHQALRAVQKPEFPRELRLHPRKFELIYVAVIGAQCVDASPLEVGNYEPVSTNIT